MIDSQWFSLQQSPWTLAFSVVLVAATAWFSYITIRRNGFAKATVCLEFLRVVLVLMITLTLNQPEWKQRFRPDEQPVLAILWDDSFSMDTIDVKDAKKERGEAVSRAQWVEDHIRNSEIWKSLPIDTVIESFSSNLKNPKTGSDLDSALKKSLENHKNLRGVVLVSDGSWNTGVSPGSAALVLRTKKVPVFSVVVGGDQSLPDVEVISLDAAVTAQVNKPLRIPFSIGSTLGRRKPVSATISTSMGEEFPINVELPAQGKVQDVFVWNPNRVGDYTITLSVPIDSEEVNAKNNSISVPVTVQEKPLRVLMVESFPRWEYRYMRNALMRDPGVEVNSVLFHPRLPGVGGGKGYLEEFPKTLKELKKYDVIFLGDVGVGSGQLTIEDCQNIKGMVRDQKSGLILMPGFRGKQLTLLETELEELFPIQFDLGQPKGRGYRIPSKFELTEFGRKSLLTKLADTSGRSAEIWRTLPGFQWCSSVLRAKAGTQILAVHQSDRSENGVRIPLLVTKTYGRGKILFMGTDGAWRWREGVEDKYHYRFWGQVARWMAYQRQMADADGIMLSYSPGRPKVGATLTLDANVEGPGGDPLQSGTVNVTITSPSKTVETIRLVPPAGQDTQWGLFSGKFQPKEKGLHRIVVACSETAAAMETTVSVQGGQREQIGKPANGQIMKQIAKKTRGKIVSTDQLDRLFEEIESLPEPEPRIRTVRIWASPIWGGLIIGLLGVFWVGRKLNGKI